MPSSTSLQKALEGCGRPTPVRRLLELPVLDAFNGPLQDRPNLAAASDAQQQLPRRCAVRPLHRPATSGMDKSDPRFAHRARPIGETETVTLSLATPTANAPEKLSVEGDGNRSSLRMPMGLHLAAEGAVCMPRIRWSAWCCRSRRPQPQGFLPGDVIVDINGGKTLARKVAVERRFLETPQSGASPSRDHSEPRRAAALLDATRGSISS